MSAALFTAGSVLFAALGLATALLHLHWGVLFQSRIVLTMLSALLLALAIANFGWRGLRLPAVIASAHGVKFLEPFVSGLVCALLSTPCTGPLLGGVLVFALAQPAPNIVALFVSIGVGLASPYALLILRPALLLRFPRAGGWSDVVRQSFSWILSGAAIFFVRSVLPAAWEPLLWFCIWSRRAGMGVRSLCTQQRPRFAPRGRHRRRRNSGDGQCQHRFRIIRGAQHRLATTARSRLGNAAGTRAPRHRGIHCAMVHQLQGP